MLFIGFKPGSRQSIHNLGNFSNILARFIYCWRRSLFRCAAICSSKLLCLIIRPPLITLNQLVFVLLQMSHVSYCEQFLSTYKSTATVMSITSISIPWTKQAVLVPESLLRHLCFCHHRSVLESSGEKFCPVDSQRYVIAVVSIIIASQFCSEDINNSLSPSTSRSSHHGRFGHWALRTTGAPIQRLNDSFFISYNNDVDEHGWYHPHWALLGTPQIGHTYPIISQIAEITTWKIHCQLSATSRFPVRPPPKSHLQDANGNSLLWGGGRGRGRHRQKFKALVRKSNSSKMVRILAPRYSAIVPPTSPGATERSKSIIKQKLKKVFYW